MNTDFPKYEANYLNAKSFQDKEMTLTYKGWKKKANEDRMDKDGKLIATWKELLKFQLRYSYPQFRLDEAGEQVLGKDGQPQKNSNYDPKYPKGYTITYIFEEGELDCGSLPLFNQFRMVQPKAGDKLAIKRTGEGKETVWTVKKLERVITDSFEDMSVPEDEEAPF